MDIEIDGVDVVDNSPDKLVLKDYTSMIGVGGKLNMMVVISFQNDFLDKLVALFMDGEEVDEDDEYPTNLEDLEQTANNILSNVNSQVSWLGIWSLPKRMQYAYKSGSIKRLQSLSGVIFIGTVLEV